MIPGAINLSPRSNNIAVINQGGQTDPQKILFVKIIALKWSSKRLWLSLIILKLVCIEQF